MLPFKNAALVLTFYVSIGIISRVYSAYPMVAFANVYAAAGTREQLNFIGTVNFTQDQTNDVLVKFNLNLRSFTTVNNTNSLGFHIHEFGTLDNSCLNAGGHYNPTNVTHGGPWNSTRHVGDLGNINRTQQDPTVFEFKDSVIKLTGPYSIVGRTIVIHNGQDDYGLLGTAESAKTGNSGIRIACGIIGVNSDFNIGSGTELLTSSSKTLSLIATIVVMKNLLF